MDPRIWGGFCLLLVSAALLAAMAGCSTTRYLTEEEDQSMREKCEATGCVAIPVPLYRQILEFIQRSRTI